MAARRGRSNRKSKSESKEILDYRHKDVKRKNNPEEGLATYLPEEHETKKYEYDPHLDPQLVWAGKAEHTSFNVPVVPLHIHERITPKSIVDALKKRRDRQAKLFDEGDYPIEKRVDFYKHDVDWANRLVLGDSMIVISSLLTKELMGGKTQMIYVDPPYGIKFSSNFQPKVASREVREDDNDLTREPEQIKAYRDTWELGIHSWLTYLRDRLLLCRELLAESGSIFLQINNENLHYAQSVMEEVFGRENFCGLIAFRKTGGIHGNLLPSLVDYLVWYARDKEQVKFHQLLFKKRPGEIGATQYRYVFDANGKMKELSPAEVERANPEMLFTHDNLTSQSSPGVDFNFKGKIYRDKFKSNPEGLARLAKAGRIVSIGNTLRYVRYLRDFPYTQINQFWHDTGISGFEEQKKYVVQTSPDVIERCVLMTTDPGDLVFDPTSGSGQTALVAEKWGRRWIVCDTSRVAHSIARQRLITATFPYFVLANPTEGVRSGFEYETSPHVTLKSITRDEPPESLTLYDQPKSDASVVRVNGPFTVEGIPAPSISSATVGIEVQREDYLSTLIEAVRTSGIVFSGGKKMRVSNLVRVSSAGFIHAEGIASDEPATRVAISFGPRYGPIGAAQTEEAIRTATANGYAMLILAGFALEPGAMAFVERTALKLKVQFAYINPDMEVHDLLKQTQASQLFTVFGEPDVSTKRERDGQYVAVLNGVDVYDPSSGNLSQTAAEDLPAWFLDEDYDGFSFNICQAFFPDGATRESPWDKLENALRGTIDAEKMEMFRGTTSMPFQKGMHSTIAVKVIDQRGNEVIRLVKLQAK